MAIDRSRLPVQLRIPGTPDNSATPVDASEYDFGDYLHVVDLTDGTARLVGSAQLAHRSDEGNRPLLSPDHAHVAYASRRSIVVIDVATGREQAFPLPASAPVPNPCLPVGIGLSWAPDSARVAVNTERALLVLDTGSGSYRAIVENTSVPGSCSVAWSPDGAWIVFSNNVSLVRIRPDGSERFEGPPYYAFPEFSYSGPREFIWSSDSTQLYFSADRAGELNARISFASGLDLRAHGIPIGQTIAWQTAPMYHDSHELPFIEALSTSGTRAAYIRSDHDENWRWTDYLETRDIDGTNSQTLVTRPQTGGSIAYAPFWSPDDRFIAYPHRLNGGGPSGSARIVSPDSADDMAAALGPDSFELQSGRWVRCDVVVVGWLSTTSLVTLTACEGTI